MAKKEQHASQQASQQASQPSSGFSEIGLKILRAIYLSQGRISMRDLGREIQQDAQGSSGDASGAKIVDEVRSLVDAGILLRSAVTPSAGEPPQWLLYFSADGLRRTSDLLLRFAEESRNLIQEQLEAGVIPDGSGSGSSVPAGASRLGLLLGYVSHTVGAAALQPSLRVLHEKHGIGFVRELIAEIQSLPVSPSWKRVSGILLTERERIEEKRQERPQERPQERAENVKQS